MAPLAPDMPTINLLPLMKRPALSTPYCNIAPRKLYIIARHHEATGEWCPGRRSAEEIMAAFDMKHIQRGARLQRSPFFEATLRHGCWGYTVYNHMFLPIGYDDLEKEYWKLLRDVS